VPFQQQQTASHVSSTKSTISTPIPSTDIHQVSTPNVATFQSRSNKAEVLVEHVGNKSNDKNRNEIKNQASIQLKSVIKPYKYMYQTIYKRANG
jgi:hypothetical protein